MIAGYKEAGTSEKGAGTISKSYGKWEVQNPPPPPTPQHTHAHAGHWRQYGTQDKTDHRAISSTPI